MTFKDIDLSMLFKGDMTHDELQNFYRGEEAPTVGKGDIIYLGSTSTKEEEPDILGSVLNDSKRYFENGNTIKLN